jgi:hypothetical protein
VWKARTEQSRKETARLERELATAREQHDKLKRRFVLAAEEDQPVYREEMERIRQEIANKEMAIDEARTEGFDVEGLLEFSRYLMTNVATVWINSDLERKQRLQQVFFPAGVPYGPEGFGTAATCFYFKLLPAVSEGNEGMASPMGFEPMFRP